jgi:hypothetical protein
MSSIVIAGDTSGSVTLQAPAVSGSTVLNLPATSGTIQASGAGYTTNGVAYATSATGLVTGSALTFDGSNLATTNYISAVGLRSLGGGGVRFNNAGNTNFSFITAPAGTGDMQFETGAGEQMRLTGTGLGIGTSSPGARLDVAGSAYVRGDSSNATFTSAGQVAIKRSSGDPFLSFHGNTGAQIGNIQFQDASTCTIGVNVNQALAFTTNSTERARIDTSGNLLVGKTAAVFADAGSYIGATGKGVFTVNNDEVMLLNRLASDGNLIRFYQASTEEGNISVSGTTVSYNGGHLSRWAQTTTAKDDSLVKGTVLSNLDEMNAYTDAEGNPVDNEQLNKVKVSDTEGDVNVAGVFVNWSHDDAHNVDEINMAMTGDMIIRIAQGVTVVRGNLLMSAGDGTAKPQGDDIVRSKTVAKVTSNHITCTYADGSYCVPCVLMAC